MYVYIITGSELDGSNQIREAYINPDKAIERYVSLPWARIERIAISGSDKREKGGER